MTEKEKSLLAGCIAGDKAAWDAFVLQYSALVYHTIRMTLALHHAKANHETIEDLYQEFFLAILRDDFKKLHQFRGSAGFVLGRVHPKGNSYFRTSWGISLNGSNSGSLWTKVAP
jgi:hypothetical protein